MRSGAAQLAIDETGFGLRGFLHRQVARAAGLAVFAATGFCLAALATWTVADPSFSHATDNAVANAMGYPGAVVADLMMQFLGLGAVVALVPAVAWGIRLASARRIDRMPARAAAWAACSAIWRSAFPPGSPAATPPGPPPSSPSRSSSARRCGCSPLPRR
jgi:S-DNA-T family DNA segregation ATPase FtsK/SpoIIIE